MYVASVAAYIHVFEAHQCVHLQHTRTHTHRRTGTAATSVTVMA